MSSTRSRLRRGSVLPLVGVSLVALFGLTALAIDVGRLSVAQTQCQNAADAAAIAGARSLDGTQDLTSASSTAVTAGTAWSILSVPLQASEVNVKHGSYHYDSTSMKFSSQIPAVAPDNYNLTQVTITHQVSTTFARVFGTTFNTVTATATAAHRPRDIAIILDYSGSMNNESDLWNNESYLGTANNSPNNADPVVPNWGPYNSVFSPGATLQCTSTDSRVGMCNITQTVLGISPIVNDFYSNNFGAAAASAFTSAGLTTNAPVAGDKYKTSSGTTILSWSDSSSATKKYSTFNGYTQGPGYWGKTFFIWPPEPSNITPASSTAFPAWGSASTGWDWRKLYFKSSAGGVINSNLQLWDATGNWRDPAGNYQINYKAILAWIKASPSPFPAQLRAGNVLYYSSIPTDVPASAYDHTQPNSAIANADQRFWKEYIDFVVGVWRDPEGDINRPGNPACSLGPDFQAGPSARLPTITGPDSLISPYIALTDNPERPRHRLWFGPMTMVQYMLDTGLLPGTAHDISMIAAKLGVAGALQDIQNNHPNDLVSLIMFSRPNFSGEKPEAGQFAKAQVSLSRNYTSMINSLWYPPNSGSADVRPWDANGLQTPRAHGDFDGNTATDYGFMLAYNQLSSNSGLVASGMGGLGRKGAQKIVILETDGMANTSTNASFTAAGAYQSYYNVGSMGSYSAGAGSNAASSCQSVATNICALDTASPPGYAQPQRPVEIHCLAFGAVFEPTSSGAEQSNAVAFLQALSTIGGTTFPSSASDPTNGYKWCVGTLAERQSKLQQAFTKILDETESILLVK